MVTGTCLDSSPWYGHPVQAQMYIGGFPVSWLPLPNQECLSTHTVPFPTHILEREQTMTTKKCVSRSIIDEWKSEGDRRSLPLIPVFQFAVGSHRLFGWMQWYWGLLFALIGVNHADRDFMIDLARYCGVRYVPTRLLSSPPLAHNSTHAPQRNRPNHHDKLSTTNRPAFGSNVLIGQICLHQF